MRNRAIVIGAGVGGLAAAGVLAEHYREVLLIEADALTTGSRIRKGTPQARHPHALLARGLQLLEGWFPGYTQDLLAHGAHWFDYAADGILIFEGRRVPREPSGVETVACSRGLIEEKLRRRVAATLGVTIVTKTRVTGFIVEAGRLVAVRTESDGEVIEISADLVVDGMGRGSRTKRWLAEKGFGTVSETVVDAGVRYATSWFKEKPDTTPGWTVVGMVPCFPDKPFGAGVTRIEGGQVIVTLASVATELVPRTKEMRAALIQELPHPAIAEALESLIPSDEWTVSGPCRNVYRHYDRMQRWPAGLVVLGDAVCSFNPIYAQGITVALLGVEALRTALQVGGEPWKHHRRDLAAILRLPWSMATSGDRQWEELRLRGRETRVRPRFSFQRLSIRALGRSASGTRRLLEVMHMLRSPTRLLHPTDFVSIGRELISGGGMR